MSKNQLSKVRFSNSPYLSPIEQARNRKACRRNAVKVRRDLVSSTIESLFRVKVNFQTRTKSPTSFSFYSVITVAIFLLSAHSLVLVTGGIESFVASDRWTDLDTDVEKKKMAFNNRFFNERQKVYGIFATNRTGRYLRGLETVDRTWIMAWPQLSTPTYPSYWHTGVQ